MSPADRHKSTLITHGYRGMTDKITQRHYAKNSTGPKTPYLLTTRQSPLSDQRRSKRGGKLVPTKLRRVTGLVDVHPVHHIVITIDGRVRLLALQISFGSGGLARGNWGGIGLLGDVDFRDLR